MFTKDKTVGSGSYRVTKKVTDWDAVLGAIFIATVALIIIANIF